MPSPYRVAFILSAPRSGSSLLLRMLHAHPHIQGLPEPHLIPSVQALAPDQRMGSMAPRRKRGLSHFLRALPDGEATHRSACRAYLDKLYGAALEAAPPETRLLVDKTPAQVSAIGLIRALYPDAPVLILRRHPAAIAWSQAEAFFGGDLALARQKRPVIEETLTALGPELTEPQGPLHVVDYETLVEHPERTLVEVFRFLSVEPCPQAVHYGRVPLTGPGDPVEVERHERPHPPLAHRWKTIFCGEPDLQREIEIQLDRVSDEDLEAWGVPRRELWTPIRDAPSARPTSRVRTYAMGRRVLMWLRRDIHRRPHGRVLARAREVCDLLLGPPR
jgi:hypothetical protein